MPDFSYTDLLPLGPDTTEYRLVSDAGVEPRRAFDREFLDVDPQALTLLTAQAMQDIAHLLRPAHLRQLRSILDDPEASPNDRFVASDLLAQRVHRGRRRAADVPGHRDRDRGRQARSAGADRRPRRGAHRARVYDAYTKLNLRYSQLAPLTMWEERNTGTNLPAQIELQATDGAEYKFLFMAKGGGSANKSYLYQETKAVLNPTRMAAFLDEKLRALGTAACPPYHLAIVVGGTSAEFALKTAKYASAKYLDSLPTAGTMSAHGFRDIELEQDRAGDHQAAPASARSSAASTSATTCGWSGCPGTARPARSRSRSRARPTGRRSARSPGTGSSSSNWRPTRRGTCRRRPTPNWTATWCGSTCRGR